jgi:pimeloyl-ACP methyl ester carboxylesterase
LDVPVPATDPAPIGPSEPWLVAVPGLGLSAAVPRHTLDRLTRPTRVVELPAFGLPAPRGTALAPAALAARLLARIDGLAVLFGHSASCQIVTAAAAQAPERVAGLVLVGPTTDPRASSWPALAARWLRTAGHESPLQVPRLVHDYTRTGLGSMLRGMQAARRHRIDDTLREVRCPVLVVRGKHDRIAPADWAATLAAVAPHGRSHTLPAGGHMVPITHPAALAAVIEEFLIPSRELPRGAQLPIVGMVQQKLHTDDVENG